MRKKKKPQAYIAHELVKYHLKIRVVQHGSMMKKEVLEQSMNEKRSEYG